MNNEEFIKLLSQYSSWSFDDNTSGPVVDWIKCVKNYTVYKVYQKNKQPKHWRSKNYDSGLWRNPFNGKYELTGTQCSEYYDKFFRRAKRSEQKEK